MSYFTQPYATPIQDLYSHAVETNNTPILEEFDTDRVYSIFKDFIAQMSIPAPVSLLSL